MKNLKLELFEFKKGLEYEQQSDIANIVEAHQKALTNDTMSEKNVIKSLNERLAIHTYDDDVKGLLENLNQDLQDYELLYELKDLYRVVEAKNSGGTIFRQPLNVLLQIINLEDDRDRMGKIMNELAVYDWVPEIKLFIHNLTESPEKKQNLLDGGSANPVYTIVEAVEDGHVAFINDSWFLLQEDNIEKVVLEEHVKDDETLRTLRALESALKYSEVSEERVDFRISENLTIGISVNTPGETFINEEKVERETTLENLFSSPIIPIVNKNFFPLIKEVASNIDKFVELDVVRKVENLTNPFHDIYAFNYKDNIFMYSCDTRSGNSFYKYESAMELIDDVRNELNYDLTYFYEDKLDEEVKTKRKLEDKIREIEINIDDIDRNIDKVETNIQMLGESEVLTTALEDLKSERKGLETELIAVKETLNSEIVKK